MEVTAASDLTIRRARSADAERCGWICYEAFAAINRKHGFAPEMPGPQAAVQFLERMFSHPGFYAVVAERGRTIVGSNVLDERNTIAGIGPITVDPECQDRGVGRALMAAVLRRAEEHAVPGVRLVQAAFHGRSLSLYAKLGFTVREPLAVMNGPLPLAARRDARIRPASEEHLDACNALCRRVHGHDRSGELADAIAGGTATIVERDGRVVAYATGLGYFGHAVAEDFTALQALLTRGHAFSGPGILVPVRDAALFGWCLAQGLRVVQPMTLMTIGLYDQPRGSYLPSILC